MKNITCNQTQQISGGAFGVTPVQMQQLAIMTGFVVPKALVGVGLSVFRLNPNGFAANAIKETVSVIMAGGAMVAGNYFYPDDATSKNQTAVDYLG